MQARLRAVRASGDDGQTLIEYGLILAFCSTAALSVLSVSGLGKALLDYVDAIVHAVPQ